MTEEIIINGVNVAGCEHLYGGDSCDNTKTLSIYCCNNTCMYKQLEKVKQEFEELRKTVESQKGLITVGGKQQYKYLQEIDRLQQENKKLLEARSHFMAENLKYFNALTEIKNDFMCFRSCMIPFHVGNKENLPHNMADIIQNYCESIMNKINEVLQ